MRQKVAAVLEVAGIGAGVAAGFAVSVALGLLAACVGLLVIGVAVERNA